MSNTKHHSGKVSIRVSEQTARCSRCGVSITSPDLQALILFSSQHRCAETLASVGIGTATNGRTC